MLVQVVKRKNPSKVLGIDTSTNSLAFCLFEENVPKIWGKVNINGSNIYEKIRDAGSKARGLSVLKDVDYVIIESAIMGKSADASLKVAMIVGASLSSILTDKTNVITVAPLKWQSAIGNSLLKKDEKQRLRDENPGKSESWYKVNERAYRKSKTINWVKSEYGIIIDDNDVSDAIGIAHWGVNNI